ncbi:MAG: hypothetical protein ACOYM4_04670 [Nodosilinea sp.]
MDYSKEILGKNQSRSRYPDFADYKARSGIGSQATSTEPPD